MNDRLKFEIGFEADPDGGIGASFEESTSWGWFRITVDGTNLCQHVVNSQLSDRVHWYLLPLLEWFVQNWDSLLHETKLPACFIEPVSARQGFSNFIPYRGNDDETVPPPGESKEDEDTVFEWWERHAIRASAQGGILPDLFFRRSRNQIEVSWGHTRVEGAPSDLRFLAPAGQALLEPKQTALCLYKVIKQAADELCQRVPNNPRFSSLYTAVTRLNEPRSVERAAWIAGIGKSIEESEALLLRLGKDLSKEYKELIIPSTEELVISHAPAAVLMFGSLSPSVGDRDVQTLFAVLKDTVTSAVGGHPLPTIKYDAMRSSAWHQGYQLANLARRELGVPDTPYKVDLNKLFSRNGIRREEVDLSDIKIRAVAICGQGLHPVVAFNKSSKHNESEPGLRFTLAHELCHLLFDEEEGVPLAVASGPWAPAEIEKRANAFAAMFLMPVNACRTLLDKHRKNGKVDRKVISHIAAAFGTGKWATLRHLLNLGLIDNDEVSLVGEELIN
jgi:Zn-dependent peptidase ImmA (M78 family)